MNKPIKEHCKFCGKFLHGEMMYHNGCAEIIARMRRG
jgi:hypothetical protein